MNEQDLDALAHRVAKYLRDHPEIAVGNFDYRQILPLADATTAVMCTSESVFYRWCEKNRVTAFRRGQYRRQDLIDGLAREEQLRNKRRAKKPRRDVPPLQA